MKTSKLCVTGLYAGNSPVADDVIINGEFVFQLYHPQSGRFNISPSRRFVCHPCQHLMRTASKNDRQLVSFGSWFCNEAVNFKECWLQILYIFLFQGVIGFIWLIYDSYVRSAIENKLDSRRSYNFNEIRHRISSPIPFKTWMNLQWSVWHFYVRAIVDDKFYSHKIIGFTLNPVCNEFYRLKSTGCSIYNWNERVFLSKRWQVTLRLNRHKYKWVHDATTKWVSLNNMPCLW